MACSVHLFNDILGGTPAVGGTWTLLSGGPMVGVLVNGLPETIANGSNVGTLHNASIDVTDVVNGVYVFRYTINGGGLGCSATADVTVTVINGAVAGTSTSFTLCNTTDEWYNLYGLIRGGSIDTNGDPNYGSDVISTNGVWTVSPSLTTTNYLVGANAPLTNQFNPIGLTAPLNVIFTYTVNQGGLAGCSNCVDVETVTFQIVAAPNAGSNASITLCNGTPVIS